MCLKLFFNVERKGNFIVVASLYLGAGAAIAGQETFLMMMGGGLGGAGMDSFLLGPLGMGTGPVLR